VSSYPSDDRRPATGNVIQGVAPPHSIEAEQSVLGAILLSDKPMYQFVVADNLKPIDFYRERHRLIFETMIELWSHSEPIDVLTVKEHLRSRGKLEEAGGEAEIDALTGQVPAVGALRRYAQIVKEHALLRNILTTTYEIQAAVHSHELAPRDLVEMAERSILEVAHDDHAKDFRAIGDVLITEVQKLDELSRSGTSMTGTPSGFTDLDAITGGFQPGSLTIVAARPGMGKSCLVTNIAENAAIDHGKPVLLFSLEMSESELAGRFLASQARVRGDDLRKGRIKDAAWKKIFDAAGKLSKAPLFVDDSSDISMLEIRAKARRMHSQHGSLGLVIIDYLQLLRPDGRTESRVEQIGQMSRGMKILAGELQCPVIALSQLNRGVEQRADRRPMLSDLRESGSIEQDADMVTFIYRDEYYNEDSEDQGMAELIIGKNRAGSLDTVKLSFQGEYPKFMSWVNEDAYA
jgi:replicative DNA helicase